MEDVRVFDVYAGAQVGKGLTSVAVHVRMRAAYHTLRANTVIGVRETAIAAAQDGWGTVLR